MRLGPHPQTLSLARSRSLGPQALPILQSESIYVIAAQPTLSPAFCLLSPASCLLPSVSCLLPPAS